jgi:hypothetical protein
VHTRDRTDGLAGADAETGVASAQPVAARLRISRRVA